MLSGVVFFFFFFFSFAAHAGVRDSNNDFIAAQFPFLAVRVLLGFGVGVGGDGGGGGELMRAYVSPVNSHYNL